MLDLVAKAFLPAGSAALVPIPTYAMYGVLTSQRAARIVVRATSRRRTTAIALDVPADARASWPKSRVVWLCSPEQPDRRCRGRRTTSRRSLQPAARARRSAAGGRRRGLLRVRRSSPSSRWRERFPNLLVVRTVSKAFALAGIRVGYGVGSRSVIERLERVRPPGSISTVSAHVAARALRDPAYARENAAALSREREWLAAELAALGWEPAPSVSNFLLVRIGDHDAAERAADGLLHAGIVPRTFGPANPLRGHLRLTVRSRPENERLLAVARAGS